MAPWLSEPRGPPLLSDGGDLGQVRVQLVALQGRADASGRSLEDITADALSVQSLKRFVDPRDIAALAVFLASDSAKSITGQTVPIDGGSQTARRIRRRARAGTACA